MLSAITNLFSGMPRVLTAILALLLGFVVPAHAGPSLIAPPIEIQPAAPDIQVVPVIQVYLVAYRAHGPPSGAFSFIALRGYPHSAVVTLYAYADGDPVNKYDPSGLWAVSFNEQAKGWYENVYGKDNISFHPWRFGEQGYVIDFKNEEAARRSAAAYRAANPTVGNNIEKLSDIIAAPTFIHAGMSEDPSFNVASAAPLNQIWDEIRAAESGFASHNEVLWTRQLNVVGDTITGGTTGLSNGLTVRGVPYASTLAGAGDKMMEMLPGLILSVAAAETLHVPVRGRLGAVEVPIPAGAGRVAPAETYLFRGTTADWPGNPSLQRAGVSPTSTNPAMATNFAIESSRFGDGVIHIVNGGRVPLTAGNVLSHLEAEVVVNLPPNVLAARAELTITVGQARQILRELGIDTPPSLAGKEALRQAVATTTSMSPEQIAAFVARARALSAAPAGAP